MSVVAFGMPEPEIGILSGQTSIDSDWYPWHNYVALG